MAAWRSRSCGLDTGNSMSTVDHHNGYGGRGSSRGKVQGSGRCLQQLGESRLRQLATGRCTPDASTSSSRQFHSRGSADLLRPEAVRKSLLSPDVLMACTHGGAFSRSRPSSTSAWSSKHSGHPSPFKGWEGRSHGAPSTCSTPDKRFYATAPAAQRIEAHDVEEATGVRLSRDQLQALRRRYQGGHSRFAGGSFGGEGPTAETLRQEVFGSIVLRPGQWPKAAAVDAMPDLASKTSSRLPSATNSRCAVQGYGARSASATRNASGYVH